MKLPGKEYREAFYWDIIQKCLVSRGDRKSLYERRRNYALFGVAPGNDPAKFNKIDAALDTLASFLFAADTTRFSIKLGAGADKKAEAPKIPPLIERLNDKWTDSNGDIIFENGIRMSLTCDTAIVKLIQRDKETIPWLIDPENFGVLREDVPMLDRQEAFVHVFMTTKDQLQRDLESHPNKAVILARVSAARKEVGELPAGVERIITSSFYPTSQGNVQNPLSGSSDWYRPRTAEELVEMHELWVWDDDASEGAGGWRVATLADPSIVVYDRTAGESMFIPGEHPFTQICPNPAPDYFWGTCEVEKLIPLQDEREHRMAQIRELINRAIDPPKALVGQWGALDEKQFALRNLGALMSSQDPTAKVNEFKPQIPQDAWADVREIDAMFDEAMGLSNVLRGKGEAGVRSKGQTDRLAQLGSSRPKKRALIVEDALERIATLYLKLDQRHNDAKLFYEKGDKQEEFISEQFTGNYSVKVDAHSSSPVFMEDQKNLAFELFKDGIIDGDAVLDITHPQNVQILKMRYKEMQAAKAAEKRHEEQLELQSSGGGGKVTPMKR